MKTQPNKQPLVLVGEDNPFFTKVYALKFPKAGFDIQIAQNGQELLDMARTRIPDIILLDLVMPIKDGFATLEELRSDPELKNVKVLITSSLEQPEDKERVTKIGVSGFVNKDNIQEIVETTKRLVS